MNTSGFKRQRAEFRDLLYMSMIRPGSTSSDVGTVVPSGIELGSGVRTAGVYRVGDQGPVQVTDNQLDLAIEGRGWFTVELPDGSLAYTRSGSLQLNAEGEIVTLEGYRVMPGITVPPDSIDVIVNKSGEVLVKIDGNQEFTNVGQLELANFVNEAGLAGLGNNLYQPTPASGEAIAGVPATPGFGGILQGAIESSNVNVVSEITNLIAAQRAYEMNSKVIRTADEMMNTTTQMR
jgi:flagellar basal-body rod protein FlgG